MLSNAVLAELKVEKQLALLLNKAVYWQPVDHLFVANHCLMIFAIICIHYNPLKLFIFLLFVFQALELLAEIHAVRPVLQRE